MFALLNRNIIVQKTSGGQLDYYHTAQSIYDRLDILYHTAPYRIKHQERGKFMKHWKKISEILNYFDKQADIREITTYRVDENFKKHGNRIFNMLHNLNLEIEDNKIMINDADNILLNDDISVSKIFLCNYINKINITNDEITIFFNDGYIRINVIE
jgi:hypothetical protein